MTSSNFYPAPQPQMPVAADTPLSHYRVLSLIGAGSAGEVYRARDARLNRDVALKIISARSADPETLRRFEVEAQSVAALNHPNVVTVYEAGREGDNLFIATELVDGESLRQLVSRDGALPLNTVLDYGLQIAEGLAAAHDEGIVHRDLKPENVMITRNKRVKIVDFGIAKVAESGAQSTLKTLGSNDTAPGLLLGTTAYMSPEQARGARVSYPADQFALGLVLYEMATGEAPLRRDTPLATLSAILTEDVPELPTGSMAFRWLVKRLLHKEPDHRYGSMHDVVRELQAVRARLTTQPAATQPAAVPESEPVPAPGRRLPVARWLAVAAAGLLCLLIGYMVGSRRTDNVRTGGSYTPWISGSGLQVTPAFAPDGRSITWSGEDATGVLQIFSGSPGGAAIQLTSGPEAALFPFWSPDGTRIYYTSGAALWSVGAAGGEAHLLLQNVIRAAVASDGRTFGVLRPQGEGHLSRIELGPLRSLRAIGDPVIAPAVLRFTADGRQLGAWVSRPDGATEFRVIDKETGTTSVKLSKLALIGPARDFAWLPDGRRVVFADSSGLSTGSHLYIADLETQRTEPLTSGTGTELFPTTDATGRRVVFGAVTMDYDLVQFTPQGEKEEIHATSRFDMAPTAARGSLAWVSDRGGTPEILFRAAGESVARTLIGSESFGEDRTLSISDVELTADASRVAFSRAGSDDEAVWIAAVNGGTPVRLGKEPRDAVQRGPSWSPDGSELVYFSIRGAEYVLMRATPGSTEAPRLIARSGGTYPKWSPRGDRIAALGPGNGLTVLHPDGAGRKQVGTGEWLVHGWAADGRKIFGVRRAGHTIELVSVDVVNGAEQLLANLGDYPAEFALGQAIGLRPFRGWTVAPDGRGFVTSVLGVDSDLWLLER
ncbi:MAG TPA: protein kinase [Bryobacteraceae bacterium]|nr:protein kinase [Bryobacteraceae bacterium]